MGEITSSPLTLDHPQVSRFRLDRVSVIVGGHLVQDTYSAFLAPLLPSLIEKLALSYTQAGVLSAVTQLPSLLNPLIGYLDDKVNLRIFIILAPAITATMMSCLGVAPTYPSLLFLLLITGVSIASFHAIAPAMVARESGSQVGKGMSLFMAAGEMGRTIAPLVAAWALLTLTLEHMFPLAVFGWIASLIIFIRIKGIPVHIGNRVQLKAALPVARRLFIPLFAFLFFRSFLITGMGVYLPTLLQGQGASIWMADISLTIYQLAGVFGALFGGTISDRYGRKPVLFIASLLAPLT
ncbi:MAG: MFS transporter, partial [Anaerolineae bacterium]|nr:MFS transporter [Anaerolineae bacterium]